MPRVSDMIPSKYLKASDFEDPRILTIADVKEEVLGRGVDAENKWVLYFAEEEKGLVLNKTNINTIADLYGDDTDDWENKKITLFQTQVDMQGKQVDAVRIRNKPPKVKETKTTKSDPAPVAAAAPTVDPDSDDPPF